MTDPEYYLTLFGIGRDPFVSLLVFRKTTPNGGQARDGGETLIREATTNPSYKTYVVAEPLFSLLAREQKENLLAVTFHIVADEHDLYYATTVGFLTLAKELNFPGTAELLSLVKKKGAIFLNASSVLNPPSELAGDSDSFFWDRTAEELVMSELWHERLHLAIDQLMESDPLSWRRIVTEIYRSRHQGLVKARKALRSVYSNTSQEGLADEVLSYLLGDVRDAQWLQAMIDKAFPSDLGNIITRLWHESRPSHEEISQVVASAERLRSYTGQKSYFSQIVEIGKKAMSRRKTDPPGGSKDGGEKTDLRPQTSDRRPEEARDGGQREQPLTEEQLQNVQKLPEIFRTIFIDHGYESFLVGISVLPFSFEVKSVREVYDRFVREMRQALGLPVEMVAGHVLQETYDTLYERYGEKIGYNLSVIMEDSYELGEARDSEGEALVRHRSQRAYVILERVKNFFDTQIPVIESGGEVQDGGRKTLTSALLAGSLLFPSATHASIPKETKPSPELKLEETLLLPLIHILGHSYLTPDERESVQKTLYLTEGAEKPSDDPSHKAYREGVEAVLKTHQEIIQNRLEVVGILQKSIREGKRVILAAEYDNEELQGFIETAKAELPRLVNLLHQRGVPDDQKKAEELYLLMYDEGAYLLATDQPILIFALVDGEIHKRLGTLMREFDVALEELNSLASESGISKETMGQWHERAVQWAVEHRILPGEKELKTLLESLPRPEVREKAKEMLQRAVSVLQMLQEKERRMADKIDQVAQHYREASLFVVIGKPRVEGLAQFLKGKKLHTTVDAKDGGARPVTESITPHVLIPSYSP